MRRGTIATGLVGGLAALLVAALGGSSAAGTPGLVVTVLAQASAAGPIVRLQDCAHLEGGAPAGLAATPLAGAPAAGQQEVLTRAQILSVLTGAGIRDAQVGGAGACVVTTPAAVVTPDQLLGAATKALGAALPPAETGGTYVVTPLVQPGAVMVPARPWTFAASLPPSLGLGVVTVAVHVLEDGTLIRTVLVPLEVGLRAPVLVTTEALPYHTAIRMSAVRTEVRTTTTPGVRALQDLNGAVAMWTTQTIPAGTVLTEQMVAPMPAVQRGAMVTVVVHRGALWISAAGVAQEDGVLGQMVPVKIQSTGVTVSARVTAPDEVQVGLP